MAETNQGLANLGELAEKLQSGVAGTPADTVGSGALFGNMSITVICINLLAGLIGTAYFMYGRKNCNIKVVCWGVALCIVPYFISNTILLIVACLIMVIAPFVI